MFPRYFFIVAAFVAFGTTAFGSSNLPSEEDRGLLTGEATAKDDLDIFRSLSTERDGYCAPEVCAFPSELISPDANVKCGDAINNRCTPKECCHLLCHTYECPTHLIKVDNHETIVCDDFYCTVDKCCTEEPTYCSSFKCGHGYTLIKDSSEEECADNNCEKSQCCDKVCSGFDCPRNHIHVDDAENTVCSRGKCNNHQCCQKAAKVCSSFKCPRHFSVVDDAEHKECHRNGCNKQDCCEEKQNVCSSYDCPDGLLHVDDAEDTVCDRRRGCTEDQCCQEENKLCSGFDCPDGFLRVDDAEDTVCDRRRGCTEDQCCQEEPKALCRSIRCPHGTVRVDDDECNDGKCSFSQCCPKTCQGYQCMDDKQVPVDDPDTTVCEGGVCTDDVCCRFTKAKASGGRL